VQAEKHFGPKNNLEGKPLTKAIVMNNKESLIGDRIMKTFLPTRILKRMC